ncbi:hypothetical protein UFOVP647_34 [uncultured Caudovirales phage]|uniref:Uncharacterized protein n=1 Tax=uncultured Caudovirales phage TaxID=2100421 RepID=A0A6J5N6Y0_9CAUD|nr:hypothetical protein UFOVP647_34 [uncultured Caudovirales phage]
MFKVGDQVKFGERCLGGISQWLGQVRLASAESIQVEYQGHRPVNEPPVRQFKQLRSGNWILVTEHKDDPKGRLHLKTTD